MLIPIISEEQIKKKKDDTESNIPIPIISEAQVKKKKDTITGKMVSMPIIPGSEVKEFRIKARKIPVGAKPVIPIGDTCCTKVCTIINDKVKSLEDEVRLRQEELDAIREGLVLEKVKILVPKKGELKRVGAKGGKVETEEIEKEKRIMVSYSESRAKLKRQQFSLIHQLSALKNMRYDMLEKGSCKCIEEVKFANIEIPEEK